MGRKTYIHSKTHNYLNDEYVSEFKKEDAELLQGNAKVLQEFIAANKCIQYDVETNVTDNYMERLLYVIQLGDKFGEEQHVIDFNDIPDYGFDILKELFGNREKTFLTHNGKFEYLVTYKFFGEYIYDIQDTFLASKLLSAGLTLEAGFNGLKHQVGMRIGVDLNKDEQITFDGNKMTPNQLVYATTDVLYMGNLLEKLMIPIKKWKLMKKYNLERKALRAIGDHTINGITIDIAALDENINEFTAAEASSRSDMEQILINEPSQDIRDKIFDLKAIQKHDEIIINWGSPKQKKAVLAYFYPEFNVTSAAVGAIEKIGNEADNPEIAELLLSKNWDKLNILLVSRHLDFLKANGMFIKKGNINLNFNSPSQLLSLFKIWYPQLGGVGVKDLARLKRSPLIEAYKKNAKASKLVSSFGEKMKSYISEDGKIHGNFTQLVPSGSRMSSSRPNLQQMPSTEAYRRIFIPDIGWVFIDADYSSAEIFIAAAMSGDKVMAFAIKNGYDMHSYSASLIFGQEWLDAGGDSAPTGKPKTKAANKLRKASKSLSFSLFYGTGVQSLSENLKIPVGEGKILMKKYYETFPELAVFFKEAGQEALNKGFVREPFFGGVRFFNKARNGMEASHNKNAGMNYKPQACNGSITKYALALVKAYIEKNNLDADVKIVLTVHDQILVMVKEHLKDEWAVTLTQLMEKAALPAVPGGQLKAESLILEDHWTK